ncbi:chitin disaccharide deacetylase [[Eubacterium] hominis]|uniref:chitin disaccharide deacetylase n=1 Tax=[Eubacterium] hominis TaxID=2764325 RepID=UPI003A4D9D8E
MRKLIINADDFGLSEAVNYGILKGFQEGVVTSSTIMANMPAFDHAIALAKANPDLGIGVHLNVTCYKPLLPTHKTLIEKDGYFRNQRYLEELDEEEIYQECKAQMEKVLATGIRIDHIDSHHHIHTTKKMKPIIERLLKEYPYPIRGGFTYQNDALQSELTIAFYDKGVSLESFKHIVTGMSENKVYDLMCHPAYVDKFLCKVTSYAIQRIDELDILCSKDVKTFLDKEQIQLTTYQDVK